MQIITGMHRSGSSLLAKLLFEAGADLGDAKTFYPGDRWNPDGYYEQPDIHAVNMPLIHGPWGKISYFFLPSTKTILKRARKLTGQIQNAAQKYRGKIVKETRFCLTLPAWIQNEADISKAVICLREPAEVAASLHKRNGISLKFALKLWQTHYERLLNHLHTLPHWYVHYNHLLDPKSSFKEIEPVFSFLGQSLSENQWTQLSRTCVKPMMNHNSDYHINYPKPIRELWNQLLTLHRQQANL